MEQGFSEQDWKLFSKKIGGWQEKYIKELNEGYSAFLKIEYKSEATKLWKLRKVMREDSKAVGVQIDMRRSRMIDNILSLIHEEAITLDDLEEFSDELKDTINGYLKYYTLNYKKIKVTCKDLEDKFYRVLLVGENLSLKQLGFLILTAFKVEFEHMYLFRDANNSYVWSDWVKDWIEENVVDYEKATIRDLKTSDNKGITLEYDTGEGWEFDIEIYEEETSLGIDQAPAICIEGKGDCIWEDNISNFYEFLRTGKLSCDKDAIWNVYEKGEDPLDFHKELDLNKINISLKKALKVMRKMGDI